MNGSKPRGLINVVHWRPADSASGQKALYSYDGYIAERDYSQYCYNFPLTLVRGGRRTLNSAQGNQAARDCLLESVR